MHKSLELKAFEVEIWVTCTLDKISSSNIACNREAREKLTEQNEADNMLSRRASCRGMKVRHAPIPRSYSE